MDDQNLKDLEREQADNKLIGDAFQHLLDTYLQLATPQEGRYRDKSLQLRPSGAQGRAPTLGRTVYHAPYRRGTDCL